MFVGAHHWPDLGKTHMERLVDLGSKTDHDPHSVVHVCCLSDDQEVIETWITAVKCRVGFWSHQFYQCPHHVFCHQNVENDPSRCHRHEGCPHLDAHAYDSADKLGGFLPAILPPVENKDKAGKYAARVSGALFFLGKKEN